MFEIDRARTLEKFRNSHGISEITGSLSSEVKQLVSGVINIPKVEWRNV